MNLQTTDYSVIVGSGAGTKTGISWYVAVAPGNPGVLQDPNAPDGVPEPGRDLDGWASGNNFSEKNDGNPYDSETTYSPNGQGGADGGDTSKGVGLMFKPTDSHRAVAAYLRVENNTNSTTHIFYPDSGAIPDTDPWYTLPCFAVLGYKTPDPQLWDVGNNSMPLPAGQFRPFPPNTHRSGPVPMKVDGAATQFESYDISSIYNELIGQPDFVVGTSHMLFYLGGIPWYGGAIPLYPKPKTAVLRVTVDLDATIGNFDFPTASVAPTVTPVELVGLESNLRYYNGSSWTSGATIKQYNGTGWSTISETLLKRR